VQVLLDQVLLRGKIGLLVTFRGFAQRGFQGSNVSKETQTSKQLDDF
jgi:hypothetical protein